MSNLSPRSRDHGLRTALFAAGLIVSSTLSAAQLESELAPAPIPGAGVAKLDPLSLELQQARAAGDAEALARIQAQIPRPGKAAGAESDCGTVRLETDTVGGIGSALPAPAGGSPRVLSTDGGGGDVFVRDVNSPGAEFGHCMASDSAGNLYVAWQDDNFALDYIQVYKSTNGGEDWSSFGWIDNATVALSRPSIAVGEGIYGDVLLLAYVRDNGTGLVVPEVATMPLDQSAGFTAHSVPVWSFWDGYDKPVIVTDSYDWDTWYAYLTCEGIFEAAADNVNTCTWRSTDGGTTWGDAQVPFGDLDDYTWLDPDISYGTSQNRVFVSNFRVDTAEINVASSSNYAQTFDTPVVVGTVSGVPSMRPVDPEIAAAAELDNVMIAFTREDGISFGYENIAYTYSQDAGLTWSTMWILPSYADEDEFAVSLTANEGGGSWHLAHTSGQDHSVRYSHRPQDLSDYWQSQAMVLDDMAHAGSSGDQVKKGIASNWTTDAACVAWCDSREGAVGDRDTYADYVGNDGLMLDHRLVSPIYADTIHFTMNAGPAYAGRIYVLTGTRSGMTPGFNLPGGLHVPLNWDDVTEACLTRKGPTCIRFIWALDANGSGTATLNIPPNSGLSPGDLMHFAFVTFNPWDYVSNAVAVPVTIL